MTPYRFLIASALLAAIALAGAQVRAEQQSAPVAAAPSSSAPASPAPATTPASDNLVIKTKSSPPYAPEGPVQGQQRLAKPVAAKQCFYQVGQVFNPNQPGLCRCPSGTKRQCTGVGYKTECRCVVPTE